MLDSTFMKLDNGKGQEYELYLSVWYKTLLLLLNLIHQLMHFYIQ